VDPFISRPTVLLIVLSNFCCLIKNSATTASETQKIFMPSYRKISGFDLKARLFLRKIVSDVSNLKMFRRSECAFVSLQALTLLQSIFRVLQQASVLKDNEFHSELTDGCLDAQIRLIDDGFQFLKRKISDFEANEQLRGAVKEVREIFDDVSIVHDSLSVYWKEAEPTEFAQV
jgi:hypothetical protein